MSGFEWALAGVAGLCALAFGVSRWDRRRWRQRQRAAQARLPVVITDPFKAAVLAHACGPCTNVQGSRRCVCAGSCGHPRCKARPVSTDLASALQRITREDGGRG